MPARPPSTTPSEASTTATFPVPTSPAAVASVYRLRDAILGAARITILAPSIKALALQSLSAPNFDEVYEASSMPPDVYAVLLLSACARVLNLDNGELPALMLDYCAAASISPSTAEVPSKKLNEFVNALAAYDEQAVF